MTSIQPLTPSEQRAYDAHIAEQQFNHFNEGLTRAQLRAAVDQYQAIQRQTEETTTPAPRQYAIGDSPYWEPEQIAQQLSALKTNPIPHTTTKVQYAPARPIDTRAMERIGTGIKHNGYSRPISKRRLQIIARPFLGADTTPEVQEGHPVAWADHMHSQKEVRAKLRLEYETRLQEWHRAQVDTVHREANHRNAFYELESEAYAMAPKEERKIFDRKAAELLASLKALESKRELTADEAGYVVATPDNAYAAVESKESRVQGKRDRKTHHFMKPKVGSIDAPTGESLGHDLAARIAISRARSEAHRKALAKVKDVSLDEQEVVEGIENVFSNPKPYNPRVNEPLRLHIALRLAYRAQPGEHNLAHQRESEALEAQLDRERAWRMATQPVMDNPLFSEDLALHNHLVLKDLFGRGRDELSTIVDEDHDGREVPPSNLQGHHIRLLQSEMAEIRTKSKKKALSEKDKQTIADDKIIVAGILQDPAQSAYGSQSAIEGDSVRATEVHTSHGAR